MFRVLIAALALGTLSGCVFIDLFPSPGPLEEMRVSGSGNDKVLILEVSGLISSASPSGLFDKPSLTARFKEELTRAGEDPAVKALVLRINSPGGPSPLRISCTMKYSCSKKSVTFRSWPRSWTLVRRAATM